MTAVVLNLEKVGLTDEQSYNLCQVNQNWNLERTAKGELRKLLGEKVLPKFVLDLPIF